MDREQDIPFIYENGVLKPEGAVDLPEGTRGAARVRGHTFGSPSGSGQPRDPFWQGKSVDELANEQGVTPLRNIDDLRGDWPADESIDDFIETVRRERR